MLVLEYYFTYYFTNYVTKNVGFFFNKMLLQTDDDCACSIYKESNKQSLRNCLYKNMIYKHLKPNNSLFFNF